MSSDDGCPSNEKFIVHCTPPHPIDGLFIKLSNVTGYWTLSL